MTCSSAEYCFIPSFHLLVLMLRLVLALSFAYFWFPTSPNHNRPWLLYCFTIAWLPDSVSHYPKQCNQQGCLAIILMWIISLFSTNFCPVPRTDFYWTFVIIILPQKEHSIRVPEFLKDQVERKKEMFYFCLWKQKLLNCYELQMAKEKRENSSLYSEHWALKHQQYFKHNVYLCISLFSLM